MAEGQGPKVPLIMLGPSKGRINHDGASGPNGVLDGRFSNAIVVVATDAAVFDALPLGGQFGGKLLGGVDPIVRTVVTDVDTNTSGFTLKSELGLNSLSPSETNLMDDGEFPTGSIAEDGPAAKLLSSEVVATSGELTAEKRGLILVRENQVPRFELIQLEDARGLRSESRASARGAPLFAKLAGGTFGSLNGGGPHFNAKRAKQAAAAEPLGVLETKVTPFGVPREEALLQGSEVGGNRLGDAVEGKGLGSSKDVMEPADHRERSLAVVGDGDLITTGQLEVGPVPFEDILAAMMLAKKDLRTEESNLKVWKVVSFAFQGRDGTFIIEDLVVETTLLMRDKLTGDAIHGERHGEVNEGPRNKIREARTDAFGTA
jgi:hypothetical protein